MFYAQAFGLRASGSTQEEAVGNCLAMVAKRIVAMAPVDEAALNMVPVDVAAWLPEEAPKGYRLVVIGYHHDLNDDDCMDFSNGEASFESRAEWRCCAVRDAVPVPLPSGGINSLNSVHSPGTWTVVHHVFGSAFPNGAMNCRDCDLPKGSLEYVRGYWLPCRSLRFARENRNYLKQNPGPPNRPGNLILR